MSAIIDINGAVAQIVDGEWTSDDADLLARIHASEPPQYLPDLPQAESVVAVLGGRVVESAPDTEEPATGPQTIH